MKNKIAKKFNYDLFYNAALFALIYYLTSNLAVTIYKFQHLGQTYTIGYKFGKLFKEFFLVYISLVIIFLGLSINRIVFAIGTIFLFLIGSISSYLLFFYDVPTSYKTIQKFYTMGIVNLYDKLNIQFLTWIVLCISVALYTIRHFGIKVADSFISKIICAICLFLFFNFIISKIKYIPEFYSPIEYLRGSYMYLFSK